MGWGIDGFQGERKKDQSSLIKYISGLNKIGGKFPANEWVFLKILQSLIRGWGGKCRKCGVGNRCFYYLILLLLLFNYFHKEWASLDDHH